MRIGHGYDVHRLVSGRALILGGVTIPYEKGLDGHSDADVLIHAVMDALLGAAAMGDTEAAGAALARLEALWQADQAYLHIGTFRGDCRVESWLCQIAKNALTKELRRQRRAVPFEETHELAAPDDIFELLADKEQAMRIHASLHRLKEPYREVFTLRVLGELHFRDIADLFGKSESWAKVTFYRAKDKLIEDMEEHHEH